MTISPHKAEYNNYDGVKWTGTNYQSFSSKRISVPVPLPPSTILQSIHLFMSSSQSSNKRIAKNTMYLYIRMFILLAITLYTSRVVLQALGVDDYGLFNVIAGVVSMMGLFNSAMSVATNRYLAFELGKNGEKSEQLNKTFCINFKIYIWLSVIFVILAEGIGIWFINTTLNIPPNRIVAANWIYQFMIVSIVSSLLTTPYNAVIIAHEKMSVYAYVSILDVTLKLIIVFALSIGYFDKLILYGALYMITSLMMTFIYFLYCKCSFTECRYARYKDSNLFKELISYTGWNLFGSGAAVARDQGLNMLLNVFFSPAVNAARGLACQINTAVSMFFTNFYTAVRPQITKLYASGNLAEMQVLATRSSKFSYYLILIIALPISIETPGLLQIWLGSVPLHTIEFTRLALLISAVDALANPIMTMAHATGKIKLYQAVVGTIIIFTLPVSYLFLRLGYPPSTVFVVSLVLTIFAFVARLCIVKNLIPYFSLRKYIKDLVPHCLFVTICSFIPVVFLHIYLPSTLIFAIINCILFAIITILAIYAVGLKKNEKDFILHTIKCKINKK